MQSLNCFVSNYSIAPNQRLVFQDYYRVDPLQNNGESFKMIEKNPPEYDEHQLTNMGKSQLKGEELARVRYQELAKTLITNKASKEAMFTFQWVAIRGGVEEFNESKHIMEVKITLSPDESLKLEGDGWNGIIRPDGKIEGDIPSKLIQFLTYDRIKHDDEFMGKITHKIDHILNEGGRTISIKPIYKDEGKERADDLLKEL